MIFKNFTSVLFGVMLVGCSSAEPLIMVDGSMDGRSYSFCDSANRVETPMGYFCADIEHLRFQVATDGRYNKTDIEKKISNVFNETVVKKAQELYESAGKKITYIGPLGTFPENERINNPGEKTLRIEVHLIGSEKYVTGSSNDSKECRDYFILMISKEMYLRSPNSYCSKEGRINEASLSQAVVKKIHEFLYRDLFYINEAN